MRTAVGVTDKFPSDSWTISWFSIESNLFNLVMDVIVRGMCGRRSHGLCYLLTTVLVVETREEVEVKLSR